MRKTRKVLPFGGTFPSHCLIGFSTPKPKLSQGAAGVKLEKANNVTYLRVRRNQSMKNCPNELLYFDSVPYNVLQQFLSTLRCVPTSGFSLQALITDSRATNISSWICVIRLHIFNIDPENSLSQNIDEAKNLTLLKNYQRYVQLQNSATFYKHIWRSSYSLEVVFQENNVRQQNLVDNSNKYRHKCGNVKDENIAKEVLGKAMNMLLAIAKTTIPLQRSENNMGVVCLAPSISLLCLLGLRCVSRHLVVDFTVYLSSSCEKTFVVFTKQRNNHRVMYITWSDIMLNWKTQNFATN